MRDDIQAAAHAARVAEHLSTGGANALRAMGANGLVIIVADVQGETKEARSMSIEGTDTPEIKVLALQLVDTITKTIEGGTGPSVVIIPPPGPDPRLN